MTSGSCSFAVGDIVRLGHKLDRTRPRGPIMRVTEISQGVVWQWIITAVSDAGAEVMLESGQFVKLVKEDWT